MSSNTKEINLSKIDWSKLNSQEDFHALSEKVAELTSVTTKAKPTPKGSKTKMKLVEIKGVNYYISEDKYLRLISLKSEKSLQNLMKEIQETHEPVQTAFKL